VCFLLFFSTDFFKMRLLPSQDFDPEDFIQLLKLTRVFDAAGQPKLTDWELDYLLRATPDPANLAKVQLPDGTEVSPPELIAYHIDAKRGADQEFVLATYPPYKLWINTSNDLYSALGFPDKHPYAKRHFYSTNSLYTEPELAQKDTYLPYVKYQMTHYGWRVSRPSHQKHELHELAKAFSGYYQYFSPGNPGYEKLKLKYPANLNTTNYKDGPTISRSSKTQNGDFYVLKVGVPHIGIAATVQCLPYVKDPAKVNELRTSLKYALYCKLVYSLTLDGRELKA